MNLLSIIKHIYNHPFNAENRIRGILRFIKWQINCILNPYPIIYPFTERSKLIIWKGLSGATGNIYCGLIEYEEMAFLLHFLQCNDLFIDIGANVGVYTILSSAEIGAKTIAIEPVPSTFNYLINNVLINNIQDKVKAFNIGLGSENGILCFTRNYDTANHVAEKSDTDTIEVEAKTLDSIIIQEKQYPVLIKIDVEGFEMEVLKGSYKTLQNDTLKAIIIELNGSGKRYGYDEKEIHRMLLDLGFRPIKYNPILKKIEYIEQYNEHNTIYIRDKQFIENRIKNSRPIRVGNSQQVI